MFSHPFFWLIVALPLGVAGQNLGVVVATTLILTRCYRQKNFSRIRQVAHDHRGLLLSGVLFLFAMLLSGFLNENYEGPQFHFIYGHLFWLLFPILSLSFVGVEDLQKKFLSLAVFVLIFWAALSLSQFFFAYKIKNFALQYHPLFMRARGFYSHPLTLAYVAVLLWPVVLITLFVRKNWPSLLACLAVAVLIFTSGSRAIQLVALACVTVNGLVYFHGRLRQVVLAGILLSTIVVAATENPISNRIKVMFESGKSEARETGLPDDRLAFWMVHSEMFLERPLWGHGADLSKQYRAPYYDRLGFQDLKKKYEAHNMFLQIAVNSGLLGLLSFLAWLFFLLKHWWIHRSSYVVDMWGQAIICLSLGGLTQNAFQDSEVRYTLTIVATCLLVAVQTVKSHQKIPG